MSGEKYLKPENYNFEKLFDEIIEEEAFAKADLSQNELEGDLCIEPVHPKTIEMIKLLQSFQMSSEIIEKFIANKYDIDLLKKIERPEIEEMIRDPFLGDRTKLIDGLNSWRKSMNLSPVTSPLSEIQNNNNKISRPRTSKREELTATFLLQASARGRQIIECYREQKFLTKPQKRLITHIRKANLRRIAFASIQTCGSFSIGTQGSCYVC